MKYVMGITTCESDRMMTKRVSEQEQDWSFISGTDIVSLCELGDKVKVLCYVSKRYGSLGFIIVTLVVQCYAF